MNISTDTEQGKRYHQEDRIVYDLDIELFAIIDGHGGDVTADIIAHNVVGAYKASNNSFMHTFAALHKMTQNQYSGAAVSLVKLNKEHTQAHVAVLGDCPVIIGSWNQLSISPEHNVRSNLAERESVTKNGGFYSNGYAFASYSGNGLQMSRSLGDVGLSRILNRVPEVYSVNLNQNSFILLATDGLFDPSHMNADVKPIIQLIKEGATAYDLVKDALIRDTGDNVSAILIRLGESNVKETVA